MQIHNTPKTKNIMQVYDISQVKEYYKTNRGFLFSSKVLVRTDSIKDWKTWEIECDELPDVLLINGEEYKLNKLPTPNNKSK